jgi:glycosyltransferase involved in cell wall biosynthesis
VNTIVSVFGVAPLRIGGAEAFARELSLQAGRIGWKSILCFLSEPPRSVRSYLELSNVSVEVIPDSFRAGWKPTNELIRVLRKHRPEILHLHFTGFLGPYPWLARLCSVEKIFFTDHASQPEGGVVTRAPLSRRIVARMVNWPINRVFAVSQYGYRAIATRDLVSSERLEMIYNSADIVRASAGVPRAAEFRRKYGIPDDRMVIAQVGSIIPEKGIGDLLGAARLVLVRNPNAHFVFVGEGSHREYYSRLSAEQTLHDRVTWTGLVEDPLSEGAYSAADIVCQVSRWEEAFGYVLAEAMASRKPIIATRVGGIPEVVEEGRTGFLAERGDAAEMADKILLLMNSPDLRDSMGQAGYEAAIRKFDVRRNVARLLESYGIPEWRRLTSVQPVPSRTNP